MICVTWEHVLSLAARGRSHVENYPSTSALLLLLLFGGTEKRRLTVDSEIDRRGRCAGGHTP